MIRINLLPSATRQSAIGGGSAQGWIIGYLLAVAAVGVGCAYLYVTKNRELNEQEARNDALEANIASLEAESANIDEIRAQLDQSRQLEEVVDELQRARYGPTAVLMEISQILSVDGGPTIDPEELEERCRRDPLARYNVGWDVHRLWLSEFVEESRDCLIRGVGKTNEDVAEFIRRLILSERFERVELVKTESAQDTDTGLPTTRFELTCGVIY